MRGLSAGFACRLTAPFLEYLGESFSAESRWIAMVVTVLLPVGQRIRSVITSHTSVTFHAGQLQKCASFLDRVDGIERRHHAPHPGSTSAIVCPIDVNSFYTSLMISSNSQYVIRSLTYSSRV